ncbi:hypothetical protein ACFOEY_18365 [Paracandidimonas soli]|uniref:hypothetical protein n=1 Tax=Paracandidimonas soli TaxID=1917182 RepID=UPI0036194DBB
MTEAASLEIWSDDAHVATIAHQARDDAWQLEYTRQWRELPEAFALCPSLPLEPGRPPAASPSRCWTACLIPPRSANLPNKSSISYCGRPHGWKQRQSRQPKFHRTC